MGAGDLPRALVRGLGGRARRATQPRECERDRWPSAGQVRLAFGTWNAALAAAGLDPANRVWLADEVRAALQTWASGHGQAPTQTQGKRAGADHPAASTVSKHFGTWRAGLQAAGLAAHYEFWDRERVLAALRAWTAEHDRPPTASQWKRAAPGRPSNSTVIAHFGSWRAGLAAAAKAG